MNPGMTHRADLLAAKPLHLPITGRIDGLFPYAASPAASRNTAGIREGAKVGRPRVILFGRLLDAVFAPSGEMAGRHADNGVDPGRVRVLPDGVCPEAWTAYVDAMLTCVSMTPPRPAQQRRARPAGALHQTPRIGRKR